MNSRTVQYYFGRLNLIANYENKQEFLLEGLRAGRRVQKKRSVWGFFEVEEIQDNNADAFIYGYLVKYKPETEEEVVIPETQQIEDEAVKNRLVAKSRFFLHIETGIIGYHPVGGKIERGQFIHYFVEVFLENHDRFFVSAVIESIGEDYRILDEIKKMDIIQEVSISLHPSNPSNRDLWERTDRRIKELNASSYQERLEASPKSDGLKIVQDEETTGKIAMADDGYGRAEVKGQKEGKVITISTTDNPIVASAPTDEAPVEDIFRTLLPVFRSIRSRFQK